MTFLLLWTIVWSFFFCSLFLQFTGECSGNDGVWLWDCMAVFFLPWCVVSTNHCDVGNLFIACGVYIVWSGFWNYSYMCNGRCWWRVAWERFGWWYLWGILLSSLSAVFPRSWQSGTGNDWWREPHSLLNFTTVCTGALELCLTSFPALGQTLREQWTASIYSSSPPSSFSIV